MSFRDELPNLAPSDIPMVNTPTSEGHTFTLWAKDQIDWLAERVETLMGEKNNLMGRIETLEREKNGLEYRLHSLESQRGASGHSGPSPKMAEPKLADPPLFHGDKKNVEEWLTACTMKIKGQPSRFPNESAKIIWAGSFLRDQAMTWFQPLFAAYERGETPNKFRSFDTFKDAFRALYGDPNQARNALIALDHLEQTGSVAEYTAKFESLRQYVKFNDEALRWTYYRGLASWIKDELV